VRRELSDLLNEVELDRVWYDASGGGVTLSGGEPCAQAEFASAFLEGCRRRALHTALDTCGQAPARAFAQVLDHADLVLFDLKHGHEATHRELTGTGLGTIRANLREAARRARGKELKLWVRTPLVPHATAEPEAIESIGRFMRDELDGAVDRWELCAFNPSCAGKYRRLGLEWAYRGLGLQTDAETSALLAVAEAACGQPGFVHLQGVRRGGAPAPGGARRQGDPCGAG
jgi:pyruvate formate lyase activating enzyme